MLFTATFPFQRTIGLTILLLLSAICLFVFDGIHVILKPATVDVQIILSTYREPQQLVANQISSLRQQLAKHGWSAYVVLYSKDEALSQSQIEFQRQTFGADLLVKLPNIGREGATFLQHIISEYDSSTRHRYRFPPSRHILFAQSLLDDPKLVASRLSALQHNTAFMSLGRYAICVNASDLHGQRRTFSRMRDIYAMFTDRLLPIHGQLCTYKGQFIVSRSRILQTKKPKYQYLLSLLQAPEGHWIYDEPEDKQWDYHGQKSGPSSPYFGHVVERSWPAIFNCTDLYIASSCTEDKPTLCQCIDYGKNY